ncbi:MAG: fibronectin type III domain-containing protein, partial [Gemmatimonadaceae bacterium]|nr:fibronectin type III domain-containing protein [Gemmatimonadaceae bacterium]
MGWRHVLGAIALGWLAACADGLAPLSSADAPQDVTVAVARAGAVRLRWTPASGQRGTVLAYIIERRTALDGPFVEVARVSAAVTGELQWLDTDVAPETIYGYRVSALTDLGDRSSPSVIAGIVTPPPPGIQVVTTVSATVTEALDADGYQLMIAGPDTITAVL